jgi:hypothetical protein
MPLLRILALFLLFVPAAHAEPARHSEADAVAATIEANYFDAERGARIAAELRADTAKGAFDAAATPQALAAVLTARLRPIDRHFRVEWSAEDTAIAGATPTGEVMQPRMRVPPGGGPSADQGIRRVEVLPGNIGLLSLGNFAPFEFGRRDQPARAAIDAALQRLSHTDAVVIDLRGNPGGAPQMVGYLVSAFTPRNAPIYNVFHSRMGTMSEAPAEWYPTPRLDVTVYVLVDAHTGSAAESFAYTMQHAGRAKIVGEHSGGAANPGRFFEAGHGFRVFVPTGSPINPISGGNWEGTGVVPDVATTSDAAMETAIALSVKAAKH